MSKPYTHDGHTYTFARTVGQVITHRDDGAILWDVRLTSRPDPVTGYYVPVTVAGLPAIPTIREAQALIRGEPIPTHIHRIIWARTEYEACRIRETEDAATRHPEPVTPNP